YGGSLENRARLLRELIEDTREAVGDHCAVAVRFAADELIGEAGLTHDGEARDVIEMLAELPDLWDINLSNWPNDSQTSRFAKEGFQEEYTRFVKQVTSKPVVGGRVSRESRLPGLSEWARVRDWRVTQIERMANVSIYRASELEAEHVLEFGARHVAIATGASWRGDGVGRDSGFAIAGFDGPAVYSPHDIMSGRVPNGGPGHVWDDDNYLIGWLQAEL